MKSIDPGLVAHLESGATTLCQCWRIDRRDGVVLGFTDHDAPLEFDGVTYEPRTGADGSAMEATADLAVNNASLEGLISSDRVTAEDLAAGLFDGASVTVSRVNWQQPDQRTEMGRGTLGEIRREGSKFIAEIRGASEALSRPVGRVYQRQCDAVVGDRRCGVNLTAPNLQGAGTVSQLLDVQRFLASGLEGFAADWFAHGVLIWQSGANSGTRSHIKADARGANGASISLWLPTGATIDVGDTFIVTAGCDRTHRTCADKFSNLINFRGFHLMPGNDFAMSYPIRSDVNDGGRRS
ncbi:MAG: DUF2163 domain-containing protein [Pseudomonadota bacterium]